MSHLRSLLFVPGDSERKQVKALASEADALILDLEDSVAASQLPAARGRVAEVLSAHPSRERQQLWVRVNPLSSGLLLDDLVAVMAGRPDGLVLPKVSSVAEVAQIGHYLAALEASAGRTVGSTRLIVIATETPRALLTLDGYSASPEARLEALTWGSEDLGAALGSSEKYEANGSSFTAPFELARSLCLVAARAAGVQPIDSVYADFKNSAGFEGECARARRDGFTGKLAIHPDQIGPINLAFSPTAAELERARRIVAAFEASPSAGVLSLDGQMIDRPHLVHAQRLVESAGR